MRVLIACEFSGIVRDAFLAQGHDAWSCDLLPTEKSGPHIQGNVLDVLDRGWDLLIAHPPCTHLCTSGARWFRYKRIRQRKALEFFLALLNAPVPMVCVENPVGVVSTRIRPPSQVIQPYQFGHPETKKTCLWLENLPRLKPTHVVPGREERVHREPPGPEQWKNRSRTYPGIARAMATQWNRPFRLGLFRLKYTIRVG
jgi:hypothetical protein